MASVGCLEGPGFGGLCGSECYKECNQEPGAGREQVDSPVHRGPAPATHPRRPLQFTADRGWVHANLLDVIV